MIKKFTLPQKIFKSIMSVIDNLLSFSFLHKKVDQKNVTYFSLQLTTKCIVISLSIKMPP